MLTQDEGIYPDVMLFSLIALEKFAQKTENKTTIQVRHILSYIISMLNRTAITAISENWRCYRKIRWYVWNDMQSRTSMYCARWATVPNGRWTTIVS